MAKQKRIPYACNSFLEEANYAMSSAIELLLPMINPSRLTIEERISFPAQAILHLHDGQAAIERVKQLARAED